MRFVLFTFFLLWPIITLAQSLNGKTVWSGSVEIAEPIRVERGAELIVESGTNVVFTGGSLEVAGRMQVDGAVFSGENWQGILLKGCDASTTLRNTLITGAKIGIQVVGGQPLIENNRFINNRVGVELRQKSTAAIRNNRFEQNSKVGLFVKDGTTSAITGNRFERHDQYAVYIYRANPSQFSENSFIQNATGLMVSFAGSDPEVKRNRFVDNKTGLRIERAARPRLIGNTVLENEIGIDLYRRADPEIRGNRIEKNGKGVSIAYSSYPLITQNNFQNNQTSLFLEYQSSSWEGEQGGVERSSETARRSAFGGKNKTVTAVLPPRYVDGTVHAAQNWWGEKETAELLAAGKQGNPDFIHDGRDLPTFIDAGKTYPLDKVDFTPWSRQPYAFEEGAE